MKAQSKNHLNQISTNNNITNNKLIITTNQNTNKISIIIT